MAQEDEQLQLSIIILYLSHSNQSDFSITGKYCFVFYRAKKYTPIAYVKRVPDSVPVVQMFRKLW